VVAVAGWRVLNTHPAQLCQQQHHHQQQLNLPAAVRSGLTWMKMTRMPGRMPCPPSEGVHNSKLAAPGQCQTLICAFGDYSTCNVRSLVLLFSVTEMQRPLNADSVFFGLVCAVTPRVSHCHQPV
jgi:hypothetical protein